MTDVSNKRVLIVDDEPGVRRFLQDLLTDMGIQVEVAENGHVAFRKATREDFDLILMDIAMPDWNGLDAIRSIKMVDPERKIIVISAFLDDALSVELDTEENVVARINKPVEMDILIKAIKEVFA